MPQVKFVAHNGAEYEVEVRNGMNLMQAALKNDIPGIIGDCGGSCACATCHIYVEDSWLGMLQSIEEAEALMLDQALQVKQNSRLACQIVVHDELDGLSVSIPERQF